MITSRDCDLSDSLDLCLLWCRSSCAVDDLVFACRIGWCGLVMFVYASVNGLGVFESVNCCVLAVAGSYV